MQYKPTCSRIWISYERGLSFDDLQEYLPGVEPSHGVYGSTNEITKLTVFQNIYKQDIIAEIFYDESENSFVTHSKYDERLTKYLGKRYSTHLVNLSSVMDMDPNYNYDHMVFSLTQDFIDEFNKLKVNQI